MGRKLKPLHTSEGPKVQRCRGLKMYEARCDAEVKRPTDGPEVNSRCRFRFLGHLTSIPCFQKACQCLPMVLNRSGHCTVQGPRSTKIYFAEVVELCHGGRSWH